MSLSKPTVGEFSPGKPQDVEARLSNVESSIQELTGMLKKFVENPTSNMAVKTGQGTIPSQPRTQEGQGRESSFEVPPFIQVSQANTSQLAMGVQAPPQIGGRPSLNATNFPWQQLASTLEQSFQASGLHNLFGQSNVAGISVGGLPPSRAGLSR